MNKQEENELLAQWAGIECRCEPVTVKNEITHFIHYYYGNCPRHAANNGLPPDYDRDEVAIGLMNVLVGKGYNPTLEYVRLEPVDVIPSYWWCGVWENGKGIADGGSQPTIAAAIKAACLKIAMQELP